jgi:hypothetical protein
MRRITIKGLAFLLPVGLAACSSSDEVNGTGQPGNSADGSAASSGTSGSSGNSGSSNAGGSGQSGSGTSGTSNAGTSGQAGTGTSGAAGAGQGGTSGTANGGAGGTGTPIVDGGRITFGSTECTDGKDNDGDGLIDAMDPECTGPLDNDESSFATGIPGDNIDQCQDCFFDGDSGQGNDGCAYPSSCFSGVDPGGAADCFNCAVSDRCVNFCKPYTPNGCDCFGCCQIPTSGGVKTVRLTSTCTVKDANDPTKCTPCTQSTTCVNKCDTCELCVGKDTLPASCSPGSGGAGNGGTAGAAGTGGTSNGGSTSGGATGTGGSSCPTPACPTGQAPCGVSCLPACPSGDFCLTGCCIHSPA